MKKLQLPSGLTRAFGRAGLKMKKYSPEILVVGGIVGGIGATVLACKATLKVDQVIEKHEEKVEKIHTAVENGVTPAGEEYTEKDAQKDLTTVYIQTGVDYAKLYWPAVTLGAVSVVSILAGHNILRKRNAALAAAYIAVDKSFKEYRGRVVERFGEALDKELRFNVHEEQVETVVQNDDGTETVVVENQKVAELSQYSQYSKFFMEGCNGWTKDPEYNLMFLKDQQSWANEKLKRKGHLFLNEVYDMLGIDRTKDGNVVGWIYDKEHPNGDNYVDFGIFNADSIAAGRFVNGWERNIILDFNVDGPILDLI